MKTLYAATLVACLLTLSATRLSIAQEPATEGATRCINAHNIRSTRVVDDLNILFYMRGKTIYHNRLPRQCHGLAREDRFSYRITTGQLCDIDTIQVLYNIGTELREANSCRLGYFREISEEDADFMIENPPEDLRGTPPAEAPPPAEPEEVLQPEEARKETDGS